MPVNNIQDWADLTNDITLPGMQQAIQVLENYVLINTPLVEGAQSTADSALSNADLALSKIYESKLEGFVYTDDRIQQLRALLEGTITELQEYVEGPALEAKVIAYIQAYTTYIDSAIAAIRNDLDATKIELGDRITIVEDILDELLNTTIPTCCGNIDEINDRIQQINNDLEALTYGMPGNSIIGAINEVKEANAYNLGLSILKVPNTDWIIDSPSNIYTPKTPVPNAWFGNGNVHEQWLWYAEFGGNTTQTMGQAVPINIQNEKVYKVTATFKVSSQGTFPETYFAIGVSTWLDETTQGTLNTEKVFKTDLENVFVEKYTYFTTDSSLVPADDYNYSGLAYDEGIGNTKEVLMVNAGDGGRKGFIHFRQNTVPTYYTIDGGSQPPKLPASGTNWNSDPVNLVKVEGDVEYLNHWRSCNAKVKWSTVDDLLIQSLDIRFRDNEGLGEWVYVWNKTSTHASISSAYNATTHVNGSTLRMKRQTTFAMTNTARPDKVIYITFPLNWRFACGDNYAFGSLIFRRGSMSGPSDGGSGSNFATFTGITGGSENQSDSRIKLYRLKVEDVTEFFKQKKELSDSVSADLEEVNVTLGEHAAEIQILNDGLLSTNAEVAELQYDVSNIKEAAFVKALVNLKTLSQKLLALGDNHLVNGSGKDNEFRSTTTTPIPVISGNNLSWPEEFDTLRVGLNILTPNLRGKVKVWLRVTATATVDIGTNIVSSDDDQDVNSINLNWIISRDDYPGITGVSIMINLGTENYVLADNTFLGELEYLGGLNYAPYSV